MGKKMKKKKRGLFGRSTQSQQSQLPPLRSGNANPKLLAVGDRGNFRNSKSELLITYTQKRYLEDDDYFPPSLDPTTVKLMIDDCPIQLYLVEGVNEDHQNLRAMMYTMPPCDVLLVCFSVEEPESLTNAESKWVPEIKHHCPGVPFLLVG